MHSRSARQEEHAHEGARNRMADFEAAEIDAAKAAQLFVFEQAGTPGS